MSNEEEQRSETKRAGVAALIGRPSVGKSTFLNAVCGQKISIVSPVPQTTRGAVRGVLNDPRGQIVFIDTPGVHESDKKLNVKLRERAIEPLADADAIIYILDAARAPGREEQLTAEIVAPHIKKTIFAINKIDESEASPGLCRLFLYNALPQVSSGAVFEISALRKTNIEPLLAKLFALAPAGEAMYPDDVYTDQEVSFRIAEIIREKAILSTYDEIPHCLYVEIADMEMRADGASLWVRAFLVVERESQKAMVIGKGAALIKRIRISAQRELNKLFPYKISLDLRVRVNKNWRQKDAALGRALN